MGDGKKNQNGCKENHCAFGEIKAVLAGTASNNSDDGKSNHGGQCPENGHHPNPESTTGGENFDVGAKFVRNHPVIWIHTASSANGTSTAAFHAPRSETIAASAVATLFVFTNAQSAVATGLESQIEAVSVTTLQNSGIVSRRPVGVAVTLADAKAKGIGTLAIFPTAWPLLDAASLTSNALGISVARARGVEGLNTVNWAALLCTLIVDISIIAACFWVGVGSGIPDSEDFVRRNV